MRELLRFSLCESLAESPDGMLDSSAPFEQMVNAVICELAWGAVDPISDENAPIEEVRVADNRVVNSSAYRAHFRVSNIRRS